MTFVKCVKSYTTQKIFNTCPLTFYIAHFNAWRCSRKTEAYIIQCLIY